MMWQSAGYTLPLIQAELGADERVLWNGQPRPGLRLQAMDAFFIPFSIVWCSFVVMAIRDSVRSGADPLEMVFLGFFVLAGLYILVGRFFVDAWARRKVYYAVTDKRVLIVTDMLGRKVRTLSLRSLPEMTLRERKDGSGDITFGAPGPYDMWAGMQWSGMMTGQAARFDMVPDVRPVYNLIQDAAQQAS